MKDLKIETRKVDYDSGYPSTMIDLIIDGEKIETGDNPISSFAFWDDMEKLVFRSIHQIKKDNPRFKFDFNIQTMSLSKEDKDKAFLDFVKDNFQKIDVEKVLSIFDSEVGKISSSIEIDENPNPDLKLPIDSHMVKMLMFLVIDSYLNKE